MKIKVTMTVGDNQAVIEDTIEIDDYRLEELTEEELENAIEINVSNWANERIRIEWETEEEDDF